MKFVVYILESKLDGSFYIGQTSNLENRLKRHNNGKNRSTKAKRPWKIIYFEEVNSRSEAIKLEQKIKRWKKRELIKKFIKAQKYRGVAQSG
ncbi:MAG: GIY-YIG nuclease family protein [Bacteroidota bacterium]